jgi:hypothetical protein
MRLVKKEAMEASLSIREILNVLLEELGKDLEYTNSQIEEMIDMFESEIENGVDYVGDKIKIKMPTVDQWIGFDLGRTHCNLANINLGKKTSASINVTYNRGIFEIGCTLPYMKGFLDYCFGKESLIRDKDPVEETVHTLSDVKSVAETFKREIDLCYNNIYTILEFLKNIEEDCYHINIILNTEKDYPAW